MNPKLPALTALSLVIAVLGAPPPAAAQEARYPADVYSPESLRAAEAVARQALGTFAELAAQTDPKALGFDDPSEVRSATLADPLPQYFVPLDRLQEYRSGSDPGGLLDAVGRLTYPLEVRGETRSSLTLHRARGSWAAESWGAPALARALADTRAAVAEGAGGGTGDVSEVRVPALNLVFVGHRSDGELYLTPVLDDPRFGFDRGGTLPAAEAFDRILPAAREHNGLPT